MNDKQLQKLIKQTRRAADQKQKKERPTYDDAVIRSDKAENQEDLDEQFAFMQRRDF